MLRDFNWYSCASAATGNDASAIQKARTNFIAASTNLMSTAAARPVTVPRHVGRVRRWREVPGRAVAAGAAMQAHIDEERRRRLPARASEQSAAVAGRGPRRR